MELEGYEILCDDSSKRLQERVLEYSIRGWDLLGQPFTGPRGQWSQAMIKVLRQEEDKANE